MKVSGVELVNQSTKCPICAKKIASKLAVAAVSNTLPESTAQIPDVTQAHLPSNAVDSLVN